MNPTIKSLTVATALAGAIGMAAAMAPTDASAADGVKCYGVSKAGQNDCAAAGHSCKGHSTADYVGTDWKMLSAEKCKKMGGKQAAFEGMNEKAKMMMKDG